MEDEEDNSQHLHSRAFLFFYQVVFFLFFLLIINLLCFISIQYVWNELSLFNNFPFFRWVARDIGVGDPERMTPAAAEAYVQQVFDKSNVEIRVVSDVDELQKEYPLFAAVNRGASGKNNFCLPGSNRSHLARGNQRNNRVVKILLLHSYLKNLQEQQIVLASH